MYVIGTAGHVDHGKSALVQALTGIDPDRLQEEKERGMTIDLGFAWLKLPGGHEVSIVDVPGHERFIKNMLAGVGGIDLALLIIAADEGVMPQTREHLAILDLLGVQRGIVVLTKIDLVDEEWLELVREEVPELVRGTTLAGAPLISVCAFTGEGLPQLLEAIDQALAETPPKRDAGRPRLPVDRVFTVAGFGTVVTGTLIDGRLAVGEEVAILPRERRTRIRGLQTHRNRLEVASPGSRVAANLAGVATQDLERGDTVTHPGWLTPTAVADVKLRLIPDAPQALAHGAGVMVHLLASQVPARVRLLDHHELKPGESGWAQIRLHQPVVTVRGDRFILRNAGGTVGGGEILDVHPRRHRRFHAATLQRLAALEGGTEEVLLHLLERQGPCELRDLLRSAAMPAEELSQAIEHLAAEGMIIALGGKPSDDRAVVFSAASWGRTVARTEEALRAYHGQYPLRQGMPKEELRSRLRLAPRTATLAIERMVSDGRLTTERLVEEGTVLRLASHEVRVTREQRAAMDALLAILEENPYTPPSDREADTEIVKALIEQGKVVRMGDGILFSAAAYRRMVEGITQYIKDNGRISHVEVRQMFNTSRRYAFAILEHMDQERITRRIGNDRVLR